MPARKKTYGHDRKQSVPTDGGTAKPCPNCKLWFSAQPRQRVCDACRPRRNKAEIAAKTKQDSRIGIRTADVARKPLSSQVSRSKNEPFKPDKPGRELAMHAARHSDYGDKSFTICTGWCDPNCACSCHMPKRQPVVIYGTDTAHTPDCPCVPCADCRPSEYRVKFTIIEDAIWEDQTKEIA